MRMDKPSETVRFLDDFDLTFSVDSRQLAAQQMSSIELSVDPVVFRVSYRDIILITTIVNKAIELSTKSQGPRPSNNRWISGRGVLSRPSASNTSNSTTSRTSRSRKLASDAPRVITSKEQVRV